MLPLLLGMMTTFATGAALLLVLPAPLLLPAVGFLGWVVGWLAVDMWINTRVVRRHNAAVRAEKRKRLW